MQTCRKCAQTLPADAFATFTNVDRNGDRRTGKRKVCRKCRMGQRSKESLAAADRRYRDRHPERAAAAQKAWRQRNPDKVLGYRQAQYATGYKKWNHDRRVRLLGNGVYEVTTKDLARLHASECAACGATDKIEIDHVIPISRGGHHSVGNLQPLCGTCNRSKGNLLLVEWGGQ